MVRESGKRQIWQEGGKYADMGPKGEEREWRECVRDMGEEEDACVQ